MKNKCAAFTMGCIRIVIARVVGGTMHLRVHWLRWVTQCFDTFCVGIWPKMVKIKKKLEIENFDIVCYISTGG